eukprot:TRINITY_DN18238_c0_g1_i2.p1 TRINITY_DN18238_c0_g1~~TRINITY_DN18238_c0_g1_i2.p1  ORF type:complete len:338 (-),score=47.28 TRINITY_DN18238_c0_g1_i2:67-1080(-)
MAAAAPRSRGRRKVILNAAPWTWRSGVTLIALSAGYFRVAAAAGDEADQREEDADDTFEVVFVMRNLNEGASKNFTVKVHPEWAPKGAERFAELVRSRFFDNVRFFRVIRDFMAQFGLSGDILVTQQWINRHLEDDPVVASNTRGRLTFAMAGKNTRTTQIFVNFQDNSRLDSAGFAPFAEVTSGMRNVDHVYDAYGEGPSQHRIIGGGNKYLRSEYPLLSYVETVVFVKEPPVSRLSDAKAPKEKKKKTNRLGARFVRGHMPHLEKWSLTGCLIFIFVVACGMCCCVSGICRQGYHQLPHEMPQVYEMTAGGGQAPPGITPYGRRRAPGDKPMYDL